MGKPTASPGRLERAAFPQYWPFPASPCRRAVNQKAREFVVGLFGSPIATVTEMEKRKRERGAPKLLETSIVRRGEASPSSLAHWPGQQTDNEITVTHSVLTTLRQPNLSYGRDSKPTHMPYFPICTVNWSQATSLPGLYIDKASLS